MGEKKEKTTKKEEEEGGGFKERKDKKNVDRFLDEWGSTVVHEQENRDSFFGPWTDKSTDQSRRQHWELKATSFMCPPPKTSDPL